MKFSGKEPTFIHPLMPQIFTVCLLYAECQASDEQMLQSGALIKYTDNAKCNNSELNKRCMRGVVRQRSRESAAGREQHA